MKEHTVKTDEAMWDAVERGDKTATFRYDDRGYLVGDVLRKVRGTDLIANAPVLRRTITHIVRGPGYGIPEGWVMLSLRDDSAGERR